MDSINFQSTRSLLVAFLLYAMPWLRMSEAYECINLPSSPLHGTLMGPYGVIVARLVCPANQDIPLNARNGGLLECSPLDRPYNLQDVAKSECLPIKHPDALLMYLELSYYHSRCQDDLQEELKTTLIDKLANLSVSSNRPSFKAEWGLPNVFCERAAYETDGDNQKRYDVGIALVFTPYNSEKDAEFYLDMLLEVKLKYLNRTNYDVRPQAYWKVSGFDLATTSYSPLFSSCDNHPNTVGTNVEFAQVASCRGCPRDYYLADGETKCSVCSIGEYTTKPFASECVQCPDKMNWLEDEELYAKYCERLQADYTN